MSRQKQDVRATFRAQVFGRDGYACVVPSCGAKAVDAHHIIERALWLDEKELGGYLIDNGASLCERHHKDAERDFIPPQALRDWAGIKTIVLPKPLSPTHVYTKWGVEVKSPTRAPWENVKYPHTPYLPFSPGADPNDVRDAGYSKVECLVGKPLIVTAKMDGSNALLVREGVAARNASVATHRSFDMLKSIHSHIGHLISPDVQVFGEWLYAKHSIHYKDKLSLTSLFQVFAGYNRKTQLWLGWRDVEDWAARLGFETVPIVEFVQEENFGKLVANLQKCGEKLVAAGQEGFVVRSIYPFYYGQFQDNIAKYVRPNHVTTDVHWSKQPIVRNEVTQPK
jgi:hypothetical protein